ncbi:hypothetical protein [uncultured Draconibacterium sp.]|uniref:hypothetical protein n=1 Tax=uncultured Draconibacterium sp. TaxID=1573823 RepID=UPI0025F3EBBB|nr:hypothetical protein [uncultured Draconibacterium sp.]
MKALILISSIFYILGLKISNKIDIVKKSNPVDKIISHKVQSSEPDKTAKFEQEEKEADENEEKQPAVNNTME